MQNLQFAVAVGGDPPELVDAFARVPGSIDTGLGGRVVAIGLDGSYRIVCDRATASFDKEKTMFVLTFLAWKEGADKINPINTLTPLDQFEMNLVFGDFRYAVGAIYLNDKGTHTVKVVGGDPFVGRLSMAGSVDLNMPLEIRIELTEERDFAKFRGNHMDGRMYQLGSGDPSTRFQNCTVHSTAHLVTSRKKCILKRWACADTGHRPPTDPTVCAHPGCAHAPDRTMYCVEAGCSLGDACPIKDKHGACFTHGYPLGMCHPVAWYEAGESGSV